MNAEHAREARAGVAVLDADRAASADARMTGRAANAMIVGSSDDSAPAPDPGERRRHVRRVTRDRRRRYVPYTTAYGNEPKRRAAPRPGRAVAGTPA